MSHMSKNWRRIEILGIPLKFFNILSLNMKCSWQWLVPEWINNYLMMANFCFHQNSCCITEQEASLTIKMHQIFQHCKLLCRSRTQQNVSTYTQDMITVAADRASLLTKQTKESRFFRRDMLEGSAQQTQETLPASWCLRAWAAPPWREAVGAAPPMRRRFPWQERLERKPSPPPHRLCCLPPTGGRLLSRGQSSP